jgi:hypothetical protein
MYLTKWFFIKKYTNKYLVYFTKSDVSDHDYPNLIPINTILSYYTQPQDNIPTVTLHLLNNIIHLQCHEYTILSKFILNISIYMSDCLINPKFEEKSNQELIQYCNSINLDLDFMTYQNISVGLTDMSPTTEPIKTEESIEADSDDDTQTMMLLTELDDNSAAVYKLM